MKRYTFVIGENPETGLIGAKSVEGLGSNEAEFLSYPGLCHDIFEHNFENDDGRAHFEYMALGFALFIRYEGNVEHMFGHYQTPETTLQIFFDSIHSFLMDRDHIDRNIPEPLPVPTKYADLGSYDFTVEDCIGDYIESEMCISLGDHPNDDSDETWDDLYPQSFKTYCEYVHGWIDYGYYLAHKKYSVDHDLSSYVVGEMQDRLYEIGKNFANEYFNEHYNDMEFNVCLDLENKNVWIDEDKLLEEYYV